MSLTDWERAGWLVKHKTSREEIADLLGIVARDLADCKAKGLSADWRMSIAYNAALQAATAALAAAGYKASRESHHYRVIQSLAFTIGAEANVVVQLEQFRKKRNIGGYERAGTVSEKEAKTLTTLAKELKTRVEAWLAENYPDLC